MSKKTTKNALLETEEHFRELIENAFDIIMVVDQQGIIRYISPSIEPAAGYKREEVVGTSAFDFLHPDDFSKVFTAWQDGELKTKQTITAEMRCRQKDGIYHLLEVTATNLFDHPLIRGAVLNFRDIEERKRAEEALRESEEKYRHIFENAFDVICTFDMNLRVLGVSPSVEKALGYRPDELVGRTLIEINEEIQTMIPDSFEQALDRAKRVFSGEKINIAHYGFKVKNGRQKYAELSVAPIIQDDQIVAVICIARDITERVNTEKKLKQISQKVLMAQEEEQGRLARDLHDDLGQLLTTIQLDVSRVRNKVEDEPHLVEEIDRIIGNIEETAGSLRRLCSGLRPPLLDDLGLNSALRDYVLKFEKRWGISVRFNSSINDTVLCSLESLTLFRITQEALTNVLRHAGRCEVNISLDQSNDVITLQVQDNGTGFDVTKKEALVTSGLHGMRERAELCGGELEITSSLQEGTIVKAVMPLNPNIGKE